VYYAYSFLFGRGRSANNMPPGSLAALDAFRGSLHDTATRESRAAPAGRGLLPSGSAGAPSVLRVSEPSRFPWVVYAFAAIFFAVAAVAAARGRAMRARRSRPHAPRKSAVADPVRLDPEWRRAETQFPPATAADSDRLQRLLNGLTPVAIDRLRSAYLIETLGDNGLSEADLLAALDDTSLARSDVLDAIERAGEIGAVELRDGVLRPTSRGRADLETARAGGYRRTVWRFIETILGSESLESCPACHAPNLPRRPKAMPGCSRCGFPLAALDGPRPAGSSVGPVNEEHRS
jgi:hypothetical protein